MTMLAAVTHQPSSFRPMAPRAADLAQAWLDEITELYLLCFLLTADKILAERCFGMVMDDYLGIPAAGVREWASSQGRASVVQRAVQVVRPQPKQVHSWSFPPGTRLLLSDVHQPFAAITSLGAFERFVFVLSVIEGVSDEACALLLQCEVAQVERSRELANRLIAAVETEDGIATLTETMPVTSTLLQLHCGIC